MAGLAAIALTALFAALAGGAALGGQWGTSKATEERKQRLRNWLRQQYPDLTDYQIEALVSQYGDEGNGLLDAGRWGDQTDWAGIQKLMADIEKAHGELGDMPELLTADQINEIEQNAYNEIDAENRQIMDLYDSTFNRSAESLQQELLENNAAFSDYRNQLLTNDIMNQQAIAGSTRYELDRQQRNAISRGASAAQRLVANINTQLGTQAQSAQQSLETSNALAQQLLAHRQAQAGIRQDYLGAMNQYDMNRANQLSGQSERRLSYGQNKVGWAWDKNQQARDAWNERLSNYGLGDIGEGIYRQRYGSSKNKNNSL